MSWLAQLFDPFLRQGSMPCSGYPPTFTVATGFQPGVLTGTPG